MPDREKVIKGLETIRLNLRQMNHGLLADFCDDALALLKEQQQQIWELQDQVEYLTDKQKEQETVKPKKVKGYNPPMYTIYEYECEKCKSPIMNKQPFCMGCGRAVKWE